MERFLLKTTYQSFWKRGLYSHVRRECAVSLWSLLTRSRWCQTCVCTMPAAWIGKKLMEVCVMLVKQLVNMYVYWLSIWARVACQLTTTVCTGAHTRAQGDRSYVLKQHGGEIQLSQQRLFHLTVHPCVNDKANSEPWREPRDGLRKQPAATSTLGPTVCCAEWI